MVPYHADKYILIFNLENWGISQIPYRPVFEFINKMFLYYTGNMDKIIVYNI